MDDRDWSSTGTSKVFEGLTERLPPSGDVPGSWTASVDAPHWAMTSTAALDRERDLRKQSAVGLALTGLVIYLLLVACQLPDARAAAGAASEGPSASTTATTAPASASASTTPAPTSSAAATSSIAPAAVVSTVSAAPTTGVSAEPTTDSVPTPSRTSDADFARVVGGLVLAGLAILGVLLVLAPGNTQRVAINISRTPPASAPPLSGGGAGLPPGTALGQSATAAPAAGPAASGPPATAAGGQPTTLLAREPVLVQGIATSIFAALALYGVQRTEGTQEVILNVLIPLVALGGSVLARRSVAPVRR